MTRRCCVCKRITEEGGEPVSDGIGVCCWASYRQRCGLPPGHYPVLLEIQNHGEWLTVDHWVFRSWQGPRRMDGKDYRGAVFYLGSDTEVQSHEGSVRR